MKKQPTPYVDVKTEDGPLGENVIVTFDFGGTHLEMYDDQALKMARHIHDVLEGRDHDSKN